MAFITLLLGLILFLPNYAVALDERLKNEKIFKPLDILTTLKNSKKSSKSLSSVGLLLCASSLPLYIAANATSNEISYHDKVKLCSAMVLIFNIFIYGHLAEKWLSAGHEPSKLHPAIIFSSTQSAWLYSVKSATMELLSILLPLLAVIFIKNTIY